MHRVLVYPSLLAILAGCSVRMHDNRQAPPPSQSQSSPTPSEEPAVAAASATAPAAVVYVPPPAPPVPPPPPAPLPPEPVVPPPPPPPAMPPDVALQYDYLPTWEDSRAVLLREYFACEPATYVYLGRTQVEFGYTDDEMFSLLWIARTEVVPLGDVVASYGVQHRNLGLVYAQYGISASTFFVQVDEQCDMSLRYRSLYLAYWSERYTMVQYSNDDRVYLLQLRIGCEYYDMEPSDYLQVECTGADFRWQAQAHCHRSGSRGVDCRHEKIALPRERPWTCRDHNEWIAHQNAWIRNQQPPQGAPRSGVTSEREREVGLRGAEAECRDRESKMRVEQANRHATEAAAAGRRADYERQVAEYEKRRAAQAPERNEAARRRLDHERQMAAYERAMAEYDVQKQEIRRRNEEAEKKLSAADRRAAVARRQDDERKQQQAEDASKAREASVLQARADEEKQRRDRDEDLRKSRAAQAAIEERRKKYEQAQVEDRIKKAERDRQGSEENVRRAAEKNADPRPDPSRPAEARLDRSGDLHSGSPGGSDHRAEKQPELRSDSKPVERRPEPPLHSGKPPEPRSDPKAVERNSAAKQPEPKQPDSRQPERRDPPPPPKPPPPPPPPEKRPDPPKSSDKDKDKK